MNTSKHLKISELAELTQIPISTIKYYIREGLLPKREKTGITAAYFNDEHVQRLKFIQKLKQDKKLTIKKIKEMIKEQNGHEFKTVDPDMIFSSKRQAIIQAAIQVFREKGYQQTSVTDIVSAAGVARNTFYSFFKNLEAVFLECADKIVHDLISDYEMELKDEPDITERFRKRLNHIYFIKPHILDMLNIVKASAISRDPFSEKFKQLMQKFVDVMVGDMESSFDKDTLKELNPKLISYLLLGITEYGFHYMKHEPEVAFDEVFQQIIHLLNFG